MDNAEQPDLAQEVQKLRDEVRRLRKKVRDLRKMMILCTIGLGGLMILGFGLQFGFQNVGANFFAGLGTLAVIFLAIFFFDSAIRRISFSWRALDGLERKTSDRWINLSAQWHQRHSESTSKRPGASD